MAFPKNRREMVEQGYVAAGKARCSGCAQMMEFWFTPTQRRIPMDPMEDDVSPAVSHWATCKEAGRFRKPRGLKHRVN